MGFISIARTVGGTDTILKGRFVKFGAGADADRFVPVTAATDAVVGVALDTADPGQTLSVVVWGVAEIECADATVVPRTLLRITADGRVQTQLASGAQLAPTVAMSSEKGVAEFANGRARYTRCVVLAPFLPTEGA